MRNEASGTPDDAPSSRRLPSAVIGELTRLRHSAIELAASPATMSPAHAVQVASVLSALGVEAPSDRRGRPPAPAAVLVTSPGAGRREVERTVLSPLR